MLRAYLNFLHGIAVSRMGKTGVALTSASFLTFIIIEAARMAGILTNSYIGLLTYLLFPAIFLIGLICIPVAWFRYARKRGMSTKALLLEQFDEETVRRRIAGSQLVRTIGLLTLINALFIGTVSMRALHFMDQAEFCGTACHDVMHPEWVTYQNSPHARVACVDCHVGEGTDAIINAKLNGVRQIFLSAFGTYNRPIPVPVHQLRPARETCEKCHWPEKFYGVRVKTIVSHLDDEESTPQYTTVGLKVDVGDHKTRAGIHWHISEENEVRYASVDDQRQQMIWVDVRQEDGSFTRFRNQALEQDSSMVEDARRMDCVDCHNRATHIYENPEQAVDLRIARGQIDRSLPFIKSEAITALTTEYTGKEEAMRGIADHLTQYYQSNYPDIAASQGEVLTATITAVQDIYDRNVFPGMHIEWGTYPTMIGHRDEESGCYRCHNYNLVDEEGNSISNDCGICHSLMAIQEPQPFFSE